MAESNKKGDRTLGTEAITSLESTVGNFENRLSRKLRDKEQEEDRSRKETDARHARMLQAMATIRKALQETTKIQLGDRFKLEHKVSDFEGWPRVELQLHDELRPERIDHNLIVSAHDRDRSGTVYMTTNIGMALGSVGLREEEEMTRIPIVLKKAVREFLDTVGQHVLDPPAAEEQFNPHLELIDEDVDPETEEELLSQDLTQEEFDYGDKNLVSDADDVDPLELSTIALEK